MDNASAKLILKSLLERLKADAQSVSPQYGAIFSQTDRAALEHLIGESVSSTSSTEMLRPEPIPPALTPTTDTQTVTGEDVEPSIVEDRPKNYQLNVACVEAPPGETGYTVCIDFGTAKSKAFACRRGSDDPIPEDLKELGLGEIDGDLDGSKYSVASSVWISDDGFVFAGSHAMKKSSEFGVAPNRQRIDSIKQELSLASQEHELSLLLPPEKNPTSTPFTSEDAVCFFLAYLTDMIRTDLSDRYSLSRYTARRFTLPAWPEVQRAWATTKITQYLKRAQVLADSFRGRWADGIPIDEAKWAINKASGIEDSLDHLIDPVMKDFKLGISEPIAAGSARIWTDKSRRGLVLIVDAGAGTTDFALFLVQQGPNGSKAFPVRDSVALKMAGDQVDDILLSFIISKMTGHADGATRTKIANHLRLRSLRSYKKELFEKGRVEIELVTNEKVRIEVVEFLECDGMKKFAERVEECLAGFLSTIDPGFKAFAEGVPGPAIVFTGGSASVPIFTALANRPWHCAETASRFREPGQHLPEIITFFADAFQREYPLLAVAIGGTLPLIEEKSRPVGDWSVGAPAPGPLSKYQVTGV